MNEKELYYDIKLAKVLLKILSAVVERNGLNILTTGEITEILKIRNEGIDLDIIKDELT